MLFKHLVYIPAPIVPSTASMTGQHLVPYADASSAGGYVATLSYTLQGTNTNIPYMDVFSIDPTTGALAKVKTSTTVSVTDTSFSSNVCWVRLNPVMPNVVVWVLANRDSSFSTGGSYTTSMWGSTQTNAVGSTNQTGTNITVAGGAAAGQGSSADWHANGDLIAFECGVFQNLGHGGGYVLNDANSYYISLVSYTTYNGFSTSSGFSSAVALPTVKPGSYYLPCVHDMRWMGDTLVVIYVKTYTAAPAISFAFYARSGNTVSLVGTQDYTPTTTIANVGYVAPAINIRNIRMRVIDGSRVIVTAITTSTGTSQSLLTIMDFAFDGSHTLTINQEQTVNSAGSQYVGVYPAYTAGQMLVDGVQTTTQLLFSDNNPGLSEIQPPSGLATISTAGISAVERDLASSSFILAGSQVAAGKSVSAPGGSVSNAIGSYIV